MRIVSRLDHSKRRSNVLNKRTMFSGPQLIALADMTNRLNCLSGSYIEIRVQQTTSHDNFAKKREFAYRFVVESR